MITRDIIYQTIDSLQKAIDEAKKADSIKRIEKVLGEIDTEILDHQIITGLEDLDTAIEDYKGIERAGLTPEEYKEEKEAAFEAIQEAVEGLDIDEDALEDLENQETLPIEIKQTASEMEAMYSREQVKAMARKKGVSAAGSKRDIIRRVIK